MRLSSRRVDATKSVTGSGEPLVLELNSDVAEPIDAVMSLKFGDAQPASDPMSAARQRPRAVRCTGTELERIGPKSISFNSGIKIQLSGTDGTCEALTIG